MQNYKFLIMALILAVAMGSTLPIYNALVSYPTTIRLMQDNTEQSAVMPHIISSKTFTLSR